MPYRPAIRFCSHCGAAVRHAIPDDGDTRLRAICTGCRAIHYRNPLNVAGTIAATDDGRILLCRRNIEPRRGLWTLPAGFMELGETLAQAAARETDEEAGADIALESLFSIISVPQAGQVHFFYRARLCSERLHPGPETQEARLFVPAEIPWAELAFPTVRLTLEHYLRDQASGQWGLHDLALQPHTATCL